MNREFANPRSGVKNRAHLCLAAPALSWLTAFLLLPFLLILAISFLSRGTYGQIELPLTVENYRRFLGFGAFGFDPLFPIIILRSLVLGTLTTGLCLLLALPVAFFIAGLPPRWKATALTLVIIPIWTNLLIRTYAWQMILSPEGWLSHCLSALGFSKLEIYPGPIAVAIGMVCDFLPFMVLPLYTSVEKLDWTLTEAARDLGANRWNVFWHAILPQIRPGLATGSLLVLLPATGQFVVPDLLGGAKTVLIGNAIQQQFGTSRDWPFGSAIAVLTLVLAFAVLGLQRRKRNSADAELELL